MALIGIYFFCVIEKHGHRFLSGPHWLHHQGMSSRRCRMPDTRVVGYITVWCCLPFGCVSELGFVFISANVIYTLANVNWGSRYGAPFDGAPYDGAHFDGAPYDCGPLLWCFLVIND